MDDGGGCRACPGLRWRDVRRGSGDRRLRRDGRVRADGRGACRLLAFRPSGLKRRHVDSVAEGFASRHGGGCCVRRRVALMLACPACRSQQHESGTKSLACAACGARTAILERTGATLVEQPYDDGVHGNAGRQVTSLGGVVMRCEGCHATTEMVELASVCQFCRGHLVQVTSPDGVVPPSGVLPFLLDRSQAADAFTASGSRATASVSTSSRPSTPPSRSRARTCR